MEPIIIFEGLEVNYTLFLLTEVIEITGTLRPYNSGRAEEFEFEVGTFIDDISEGYWDENWEEIEEQIISHYYSSLSK